MSLTFPLLVFASLFLRICNKAAKHFVIQLLCSSRHLNCSTVGTTTILALALWMHLIWIWYLSWMHFVGANMLNFYCTWGRCIYWVDELIHHLQCLLWKAKVDLAMQPTEHPHVVFHVKLRANWRRANWIWLVCFIKGCYEN